MDRLRRRVSGESKIAEQQLKFRSLSELVWTRNTIYPRDTFLLGEAQGQCGVTNFGLGVWLVWRGLKRARDLHYVEGRVSIGGNEVTDTKHAWLHIGGGLLAKTQHADLTLDQYPGVTQRVIATTLTENARQGTPYAVTVTDRKRPNVSVPVRYEPRTITPLTEYDTAAFRGRLETFLGSCYNSTRFMGHQAIQHQVTRLWLPENLNYDSAARQAIIAAQPCDAQFFSSVAPQ